MPMKPILVSTLILLLCASLAQADLIRVQGSAEAKHPPDISWVSVEVWSRSRNAKKAQELNAEEHSRVLDALTRNFKLKREQIRTASYQLNPEYDYSGQKQTLRGYYASHSIDITFRTLDRLGDLLDEISANKKADASSGVSLGGIRFGTERRNTYELGVIEEAMKDARSRADAIARSVGRSVKSVKNVVHGAPVIAPPQFMPPEARMMSMGASAEKASTRISPGELTISTEVTVEYEF